MNFGPSSVGGEWTNREGCESLGYGFSYKFSEKFAKETVNASVTCEVRHGIIKKSIFYKNNF